MIFNNYTLELTPGCGAEPHIVALGRAGRGVRGTSGGYRIILRGGRGGGGSRPSGGGGEGLPLATDSGRRGDSWKWLRPLLFRLGNRLADWRGGQL